MSPYDFAHGIYGWMPHTPLLQPANSDILRCHFMLRTSAIPLKSPSLTLLLELAPCFRNDTASLSINAEFQSYVQQKIPSHQGPQFIMKSYCQSIVESTGAKRPPIMARPSCVPYNRFSHALSLSCFLNSQNKNRGTQGTRGSP